MTATAAAVKPKRTSGPSTWRRASNARRSRKLERKTHQTNCSNMFRWYRAGWGRYTQVDPFADPTWREPNVFAYVRQNPLRSSDPLGLYTVDRSCYTCGPPNFGRVGADVTRMCQNIQRPKCRQITRALSLVPAANRGQSEPLDSCLSRRCASSDVTVQCAVNTAPPRDPLYGACGQVSPSDGTITLLRGNSTMYQGPRHKGLPLRERNVVGANALRGGRTRLWPVARAVQQ